MTSIVSKMNLSPSLRLTPDKAQYRPGDAVRIGVELHAPDTASAKAGKRAAHESSAGGTAGLHASESPAGGTAGLRASEPPADEVAGFHTPEAGVTHAPQFAAAEAIYRWQVCELDRIVASGSGVLRREAEKERLIGVIELEAFAASGAYGVFAKVELPAEGAVRGETAFDVAARWSEAPRYGFLSDFAPGSGDDGEQAEFLLRHHINVVQFYDWMYRHDRLLTEDDPFTDPLGRTISLTAVRSRIAALRERGIASFAYAAVYASLPDYAEAHPEQLLYRNDGTAYSLGNFFYIMDIAPGSAWTEHVTDEFRRAIEWGFDGLHLDQYGFPKRAVRRTPDGGEETVRLAELYSALIARAREKLPEAGLIFNNVGAYPAGATAEAPQDAVYIEVWDPVTRLRDLCQLVRRTRALTDKPIILAAYLPPFHPERPAEPAQAETGAALAMATIFASGAYHLLLGENGGVLADPYYPKYGRASAAFRERLTRYYDFIVMYRDLLFDPALDDWTDAFTGGINNELTFRAADADVRFSTDAALGTVWTIAKEKRDAYVIHLVNLTGLDNDVWHAPKERPPEPVRGIELSVEVVDRIEAVFAASPDGGSIRPLPLAWEWTRCGEDGGRFVRFTLPQLDCWTVVCIRLRGGTAAGTE